MVDGPLTPAPSHRDWNTYTPNPASPVEAAYSREGVSTIAAISRIIRRE
jgi:hypothetical protein